MTKKKKTIIIVASAAAVIVLLLIVALSTVISVTIVDDCASPCEGTDSKICPDVCVKKTRTKTLFQVIFGL